MNAFVILGVVWLAMLAVRRYESRPRRRERPSDDAFSHALLPTRDWR
ncbi:MAG: hypothetical protein KGN02_09675 [bacterium]|nr:hypothetical protein [bacterium]